MINLKTLQKIKRSREVDNRDFIKGIRADRNEKVEDWPLNIFNIIFKKIKKHEFTAYYNTNELSLIEANIAKYFRIKKENFIINHGGDGVIKEFLLVNYKKKMRVILNSNNYGMYKVYFKGLNIKCFEIPYKLNFKDKNLFNLDKKFLHKNLKKSQIFFFTNPNVVSNFDIGIKEMSNLCKNYPKKLFFIDESYNGYGQATFLNLIKKHKNIFIMRSITKSIGLASSRVGFLISHKESMKPFKALQTPYPLSLFAGKCLKFFIENKKLIKSYNLKVIKGREYFCKELRKKKYLINNGNGLSILIFMRSNTNLKKKYNILLKNKIYTKIVDIGFKKFIRITCAPKNTMKKILKYF